MHIKPKNKMYFLNKFLIHSSKPYIIKYVNYKLPPPPKISQPSIYCQPSPYILVGLQQGREGAGIYQWSTPSSQVSCISQGNSLQLKGFLELII